MFIVRVGSLAPEEEVEVDIGYVHELKFTQEGELQWILPSRTKETFNNYRNQIVLPNLDFSLNLGEQLCICVCVCTYTYHSYLYVCARIGV